MKNLSKKDITIIISIFLILSTIGFYFIKRENISDTTFSNEQVPENSVSTIIPKEIIVYVVGEVNKPGIVKLKEGDRVVDAIEMSGGATAQANIDEINLAYKIVDGQQIIIPKKEVKHNYSYSTKSSSKVPSNTTKSSGVKSYISSNAGKAIISNTFTKQEVSKSASIININTATAAELDKLPGIGEATAKKIIEYREKNGTFKSIEDIMKVGGIGKSKFEDMKSNITI